MIPTHAYVVHSLPAMDMGDEVRPVSIHLSLHDAERAVAELKRDVFVKLGNGFNAEEYVQRKLRYRASIGMSKFRLTPVIPLSAAEKIKAVISGRPLDE